MIDPDLLAFLEQRFRESAQQNAQQFADLRKEMTQQFKAAREETNQRFDQVEGRFDQVEGRLEKVEGRLEKVEGRVEKVEGRIERVEETGRQTLVLVEGLRSDINLIVEGFMAQNERMDRLEREVKQIPEQLK
jgi:archaellum component FlaC